MTSIKVKFRLSTVDGALGSIYYQLIKDRHTKQLSTDYRILPNEWDDKSSSITVKCDANRRQTLISIRERVKWDTERLAKIVHGLECGGAPYDLGKIISEFNWFIDKYSLSNYMESIIHRLRKNGRVRTSETYRTTLNSFRLFKNGEDIMLDTLSSEILEDYQSWLKGNNRSSNTVSFYMRILRAVYHRAVEENVISDTKPFSHVYTGIDKTVKRALPLTVVKQLKDLDLPACSSIDFARDMFLLSFYFRGMSFIDMAYLRKTDLNNGKLVYNRRKTGQKLVIGWTRDMQRILDKYPKNRRDYLLPIITEEGVDDRLTYYRVSARINYNLKKVAKKIGLEAPLTMYVARHSWASGAKSKGVPLPLISEGMGHGSESTTRIYLAEMDTTLSTKRTTL